MVKRLSTMQETWVPSLGQEDPLEKKMAVHSSTIALKTPWTEEPGRLQSMESQSWTRLSDFAHSLSDLIACKCYMNGAPEVTLVVKNLPTNAGDARDRHSFSL